MNAIMVSVDYSDLLRITLAYNHHHFNRVMVVTTPGSADGEVARQCGAEVFETSSFYDGGAKFAKWKALELGLDRLGRSGWLAILDADVVWPKDVGMREQYESIKWHPKVGATTYQDRGMLLSPFRRMWESWPHPEAFAGVHGPHRSPVETIINGVPIEALWNRFPLHRQQHEHAGFTQVFNASDPVLGSPPWHETDWLHCGGADSFFQAKWPPDKRIRPQWEVLHLGSAGTNWMGRPKDVADAAEKAKATKRLWARRAELRRRGLDPFQDERIKENK